MERVLGGRYRLGRRLGRGPDSQVFYCKDNDATAFAVKVFRQELATNRTVASALAGRAATFRSLRHANC